jgi:CRISPR system Cascade subunit CasA
MLLGKFIFKRERMTYDLRVVPWIRWQRRSGNIELGSPSLLTSRIGGRNSDPVVAIAAPRADFEGALEEFLIGLLTAALHPADEQAWRNFWDSPPSPEAIESALGELPNAFDLEGDGPRFLQDFTKKDFEKASRTPIESLLIEAAGEQTQKLNKDLFVKRDRFECFSRPTAAMALITMQTYAPSGGQGHRTSLRGGGPLTTLIEPRIDKRGVSRAHEMPLWLKIWANVETQAQYRDRTPSKINSDPASIFPWLAPTRTSNAKKGGRSTTPADVHPLQVYFGMPRRIRLEFGDAGLCSLTGAHDDRTVVGFRAINYGVDYDSWMHPLSPYYRQKITEPWLPVHGQPDGLGWRDWLSLAMTNPEAGLREPAATVSHFTNRRARAVRARQVRIHAFGFDMDNMKARGWIEAALPALSTEDPDRLYSLAQSLVEAANMTASALLGAVKTGLFQSPAEATGNLDEVKGELWADTEREFYSAINSVSSAPDEEAALEAAISCRSAFRSTLEGSAISVFDRYCPAGGLDVAALRRRVSARYQLTSALRGYSKFGEKIFGVLEIAPPGGGQAARAAKKKTRGKKEKVK